MAVAFHLGKLCFGIHRHGQRARGGGGGPAPCSGLGASAAAQDPAFDSLSRAGCLGTSVTRVGGRHWRVARALRRWGGAAVGHNRWLLEPWRLGAQPGFLRRRQRNGEQCPWPTRHWCLACQRAARKFDRSGLWRCVRAARLQARHRRRGRYTAGLGRPSQEGDCHVAVVLNVAAHGSNGSAARAFHSPGGGGRCRSKPARPRNQGNEAGAVLNKHDGDSGLRWNGGAGQQRKAPAGAARACQGWWRVRQHRWRDRGAASRGDDGAC
mmetsp:Transcript_8629/g.34064  ORF Transcript_8629/g.34064 Transcript_8629/m.34064 type:complete len:267 (+) Transcript_8629:1601-2401(+)